MTAGEDSYRSNAVFLEVKMRELLGDRWPLRTAEPDVVRASVVCGCGRGCECVCGGLCADGWTG